MEVGGKSVKRRDSFIYGEGARVQGGGTGWSRFILVGVEGGERAEIE